MNDELSVGVIYWFSFPTEIILLGKYNRDRPEGTLDGPQGNLEQILDMCGRDLPEADTVMDLL